MNQKIAIMQPYVFPYLGYFQLLHAVDTFVFYDDVNFIKKGWVNRNRIRVGGQEYLFTIPLVKASQNKAIKDTLVNNDSDWVDTFLKTLELNYKKAPEFEVTFQLVQDLLQKPYQSIADLAIQSIQGVAAYLAIEPAFERSSEHYAATQGLEKAARLIAIAKQNGATQYINPSGGKELYRPETFRKAGIQLFFIENELVPYPQGGKNWMAGLSIIDVLMYQSREQVQNLLVNYQLV